MSSTHQASVEKATVGGKPAPPGRVGGSVFDAGGTKTVNNGAAMNHAFRSAASTGIVIGVVLAFAAALAAQPAPRRGMTFTEPSPIDFHDHEGYVSIFDGKTLEGWDGNPKFWRVEDGAIVGESTPEKPSGNSYIVYRPLT